jgi:uncharacterized protein
MKMSNKNTDESCQLEPIAERFPCTIRCLHRRHFLKTAAILGGSTLIAPVTRASEKQGGKGLAIEPLNAEPGQEVISTDVFQPLDFRQVTVGGEIGRRLDITVNNNLLKLDVDKDFLLPFQLKNQEGKGFSDYIGIGKLVDAAVRFAAYTKNEKVLAMKKHLVDELIKTQESDGYIGIMEKKCRMWRLWDIHEMGYIIMGLASDFHYFREKRSLMAAQKLADYIIERWPTMPDNWQKFGAAGLDSNMLALYRETEDKRYLDFCVQQRALLDWKLDTTKGVNATLKGHVYTDLDQCLAQFELFHIQPEERLLRPGRQAIDFMTHGDGMTITGAVGHWEEWDNVQEGRGKTGETCSTVSQIRIFDAFLRLEGHALYGDILERMIYNSLFAVQSPDGRQLHYFTPLEGNRVYFKKDTFCCPNNFRRIISHLPAFVYYRSATGVAVNLYTPSETIIVLKKGLSLKIRQETEYPSQGKVVIHLDPSKPARFVLQLRIPRWCDKATIHINGKAWNEAIVAGEFLSLDREWKADDEVILDMPMPFRVVLGRKRQSGRAAVMRGPVVFCLNPSQNESLQKKDAADLTSYMIDPNSLKAILVDTTVRPDGVACTVDANERTFSLGNRDFLFKLTEFPDPDGKLIYFRITDFSMAVQDEIISGS